jgi:hypothetical protein
VPKPLLVIDELVVEFNTEDGVVRFAGAVA